jgi:uncharacterized protein involved in exopolysaccharide biosynthesis
VAATTGSRESDARQVSPSDFGLGDNGEHQRGAPGSQLLRAARRHWFVALLPVLLFVGGAVALGLKRPPRYKATANLSVGHVYVSNPTGIATIIDATQALAAVYSRAIHSGEVLQDTRRRLGEGSSVSGSFNATPLPNSPLIKVTAESSSARGAIMLANASADSLTLYVNKQVRDNGASTTLARRYRDASLAYRRALDERNRRNRRYERNQTRANKAARNRAQAAADTALLRREALQASYELAVQGGTSSVSMESFSRAAAATSDRKSMMQILVFVGLLGGLAAGAAFALLRAARDIRRGR